MALVSSYAFSEGTGTTTADATGSNTLTLQTGTSWTSSGHTGNAIASGGTTNGATASVTGATAAISIDGWVYPTDLTSGNTNAAFGFSDGSGSTQFGIYCQRSDFGTQNVLQGNARINGSLQSITDGVKLTVNTWVHIALTYDGSTLTLYKNGTSVATSSLTGSVTAGSQLQAAGLAGQPSNCRVDDLRYYNSAISGTQVTSDMNTAVGTSGTNYTANPADPEGITDALTRGQDMVRSAADPEGITDSAAVNVDHVTSAADPVGITDSATANISSAGNYTAFPADPVGLTDSVSFTQPNQSNAPAEQVGLRDSVALGGTAVSLITGPCAYIPKRRYETYRFQGTRGLLHGNFVASTTWKSGGQWFNQFTPSGDVIAAADIALQGTPVTVSADIAQQLVTAGLAVFTTDPNAAAALLASGAGYLQLI